VSPTTILWLIAGGLMLQPLSTDLYLASLPHLATDFGVTPAAVQQTLSLFVIGFGTAQLVSGPLSDRFGRRPVLMIDILLYSVLEFASAFAPSLAVLLILRAAFGFAMGGEWGIGASLALAVRQARAAASVK